MLGDHPVDVMPLATDLDVARRFYAGTLGLELLLDDWREHYRVAIM
jgi:catechol 2,3-dioxygenase-like lactoylglutathione lyase family enzyme